MTVTGSLIPFGSCLLNCVGSPTADSTLNECCLEHTRADLHRVRKKKTFLLCQSSTAQATPPPPPHPPAVVFPKSRPSPWQSGVDTRTHTHTNTHKHTHAPHARISRMHAHAHTVTHVHTGAHACPPPACLPTRPTCCTGRAFSSSSSEGSVSTSQSSFCEGNLCCYMLLLSQDGALPATSRCSWPGRNRTQTDSATACDSFRNTACEHKSLASDRLAPYLRCNKRGDHEPEVLKL